jgi:hypothetical protein
LVLAHQLTLFTHIDTIINITLLSLSILCQTFPSWHFSLANQSGFSLDEAIIFYTRVQKSLKVIVRLSESKFRETFGCSLSFQKITSLNQYEVSYWDQEKECEAK